MSAHPDEELPSCCFPRRLLLLLCIPANAGIVVLLSSVSEKFIANPCQSGPSFLVLVESGVRNRFEFMQFVPGPVLCVYVMLIYCSTRVVR